ncbi:hypothetical protein GPECTOR_10g1078 [Gonium pectorale]|uniref:EF-hand domain-containing protein n=1 Tax=Gonium pectorale TaxID=33097 RepID=A0A150GQF9_GONPE|nr:hypothetical protein GPECTOR_10g1078 [Gonium pectorale]|eukprot:KXZ52055.1 hypothetical protein GPECTOR_10g1078 [Gonium pectorale]
MGLTDMLSAAVRGHTGLHYVPSFNDFVSGSADDVEAMELERDIGGSADQATRRTASAPPGEGAGEGSKVKPLAAPVRPDPLTDLHMVHRPYPEHRADWIMDDTRGGRRAPSVWQYILASQGKEKLPAFEELARPSQASIGAAELRKHFKVSSEQADAMVAEADQDKDNRISREEYVNLLTSA